MLNRSIPVLALFLLATFPAAAQYHTADTDLSQQISLSELLRLVQFFNSDGFHCETGTEDGYAPGAGDQTCAPHDSDHTPQDWRVNLTELLRLVQFFNSGGYHSECGTEDNFAPGLGGLNYCEEDRWFVKSGMSGDGRSWASAFGTIQDAVNAAAAAGGGEVWVATGTYTATTNPVLAMRMHVPLYGGFAGVESTREARDWANNPTIIDGESIRRCVNGANDATLDGFIIQHGYSADYGGGMYNSSASPTVANCTFHGNTTLYFGGGLYNSSSSPTLTDCIFTGNTGENGGGGVYNYQSSPRLTNCVLTANVAVIGGGMYNFSSLPELEDCTFSRNVAGNGGGMYNTNDSSMALFNCTFLANTASSDGGGLYNLVSSFPSLFNCTFGENTALNGGGVYNHSTASTMLLNCTFFGNAARYGGGGIYDTGASTTVTNSILWDDSGSGNHSQIYGAPVVTYSCIQDGFTGTGNISSDPLLIGTLGSNGRIRPNSPCIDAGSSAAAPATDIRGVPRPQGGVDMGAYELDDSDGDGLSDAWEQTHFSNLTSASESSDADTDGLSDLEESLYASNPATADSDGDGAGDAGEVQAGWDPTIPTMAYRVNCANTSDLEDGLSWETAFHTIQDAVDAVALLGEGEIWVAAGTYTATDGQVVAMRPHVRLYGGFAGNETAWSARDWEANRTILDGESSYRGVLGASNAVLDGFSIQNGYTYDSGAGLFNGAVSPVVSNCSFIENAADGTGGGIFNYRSAPTVSNCTFTGNVASDGGGISNVRCGVAPTVVNCTFTRNMAGEGGAIYNYFSESTVTNCILWGDSATLSGNEVRNESSSPVLAYSCVEGAFEGTGNISDDPLLVATRASNGRIQPGSPCIDAGTAAGAPGTDRQGTLRPQGTSVDMGAYELDDSDHDSISDTWEKRYFGNLTTASATSDTDGDGTTDLEESLNGPNPNLADSDGDGLSDKDEIQQGWDPTVPTVIRRVRYANPSGIKDGLSWATAFSSIQDGVDAVKAAGEGEVWVTAGLYTAASDYVVVMKRHVHLYGGFAGTETLRRTRNWHLNTTTIYGEDERACVCGASEATLDGFTLSNGNGALFGGGISNFSSSPAVNNCVFSHNTASPYGGGMYNAGTSAPTVINCVFTGNTASSGAGMNNMDYSFPVLINCTFSGNTASDSGGAICSMDSASALLANCILWGDAASYAEDEIEDQASVLAVSYSCIAGGYEGRENTAANPLFAAPASARYDLQSGSPCIDTGTADGAPAVDIQGLVRPQGSGYDMGAYEYAGK